MPEELPKDVEQSELQSRAFASAGEAISFLNRTRRQVLGVVVVLRPRTLEELPPDDPRIAAVLAEQAQLQGAAPTEAPAEALRLQGPALT